MLDETGSMSRCRPAQSTPDLHTEDGNEELAQEARAPTSKVTSLSQPVDSEDENAYPPTPTSSRPAREVASLPEPDRGRDAMFFLAAAFTVETVVWGLPSSYGVLLAYYQSNGINGDKSSKALLPLVGTFSSGLMYLLGPPISIMLNPRPRWRQWAIRTGAVICFVGLLVSSFATKAWQLLLSQGLLYSIGGSLCYYPTFSYLSEWFVARRGFANGICFAGTAAGGLVYPFIMEALLSRYGCATTLQALAVSTGVLIACALPRLRPRLPLPPKNGASQREHGSQSADADSSTRKKLWRSKRFLVFMLANLAQAIGYFTPALYLPTYADAIGLSGAQGSAMLAAVNATAVVSRVSIGILSDRMSPHIIGACTLGAATLAVFILWGVTSTSFAPLLVFSLALGLAAGGWTSLYSRVISDAAKDDLRLASTLFGLVSFTRGLGSVLTAPISSFLITRPLHDAAPSTAYGVAQGRFGSLVVCVGSAMGVAAGIELAISLSKRTPSRRL